MGYARVHNKRLEGEYPTSIVLPNALRKVMTLQPIATLGVECFYIRHQSKHVLFMLTSNKRCLSISVQLNAQCCGTQICSSCPWENLEKNRHQRRENYARMMERRYAVIPQRSLCEAGLTIGKRIPAPSNDWALTITLSLTGKNFFALISACSNKHCGLETPERPGAKIIGVRPGVNMLILPILISISTLCPQC